MFGSNNDDDESARVSGVHDEELHTLVEDAIGSIEDERVAIGRVEGYKVFLHLRSKYDEGTKEYRVEAEVAGPSVEAGPFGIRRASKQLTLGYTGRGHAVAVFEKIANIHGLVEVDRTADPGA